MGDTLVAYFQYDCRPCGDIWTADDCVREDEPEGVARGFVCHYASED
jgi:hypothetical protein